MNRSKTEHRSLERTRMRILTRSFSTTAPKYSQQMLKAPGSVGKEPKSG
jgi:hypothetical protein